MTPKAKKVSVKVPKGKMKNIGDATDLIISQYKPILELWPSLSPEQKMKIIDNNQMIGKLLKYFTP